MPDLTIQQVRVQLQRAEDRVRAVQQGIRPLSDRRPALRALRVARSRLENAKARA